jgi:glycerol kinase
VSLSGRSRLCPAMGSSWNHHTVPRMALSSPSTKALPQRAVLSDARGKVLDKASRTHRQIYPKPGSVEHDADEIGACSPSSGKSSDAAQDSRNSPRCITNQRRPCSCSSAKPASRHTTRSCGRPSRRRHLSQTHQTGHGPSVLGKTGLKIDTIPSRPAPLARRQQPRHRHQTKSGEAVAGTMDAYLIHRLNAEKCSQPMLSTLVARRVRHRQTSVGRRSLQAVQSAFERVA